MKAGTVMVASALIGAALAGSEVQAQLVRSAVGTGAGITPTIDQFRADLGGALNPNTPGTVGTGRREINWDAVPDTLSSPNALPANFFNANVAPRARGVVFSTPGTGFAVSADDNNPAGAAQNFANVDPSYGQQFAFFTAQRLFTAVGSVQTVVDFFVPGTNDPATTSGFGAVFSDVDLSGSRIDYFGLGNQLIFSADVPAAGVSSQTFSFLGVSFASAIVERVVITSGTMVLGAGFLENPGAVEFATDAVVMDDFVYGEPVPAPGALSLLAGAGLVAVRRRRR